MREGHMKPKPSGDSAEIPAPKEPKKLGSALRGKVKQDEKFDPFKKKGAKKRVASVLAGGGAADAKKKRKGQAGKTGKKAGSKH